MVTFSGVSLPAVVSWYDGYGYFPHMDTVRSGSTDTIRNYTGAPVSVYVTDTVGYGYSAWATASDTGHMPFTYRVSVIDGVCPSLGTMTATVTGGTAPYTYSWTAMTGGVVSTSNPAHVPFGFYRLSVTDNAGCVSSYDPYDTMFVNVVTPFSYGITTTNANCTNGSATVTGLSGGTTPYSYVWSNGATTSYITGMSAGNYSVKVTDATGCTDSSIAHIGQAVTINAPITATPATCVDSNGAVVAFGSGGTPPYSYLWSNGATTQSQTGLFSGYYTVIVTDAHGCTGTNGGYVASTSPISVYYYTSPTLCTSPTGIARLTYSGGTSPYTIVWYTSPMQTGDSAVNLAQGNYNFSITDAAGCVRTGTVTIPPIDVITLIPTITADTCGHHTGAITVIPTGGVGTYTYAWTSGGTTATVTGLPAGYDHVTVTDSNGCNVVTSFLVPYYSPVYIGTACYPACIFSPSGTIVASGYGGTTPYSYAWSNGEMAATDTALLPGDYWVTVTDASGCTAYTYAHLGYDIYDSSCFCIVRGTVYHDTNANCTRDMGEPGINHIQMHCSGGFGYTYTNSAGDYYFMVPTGTYTISQTVLSYYPLSSCQANNITVSTTAGTGCYHTIDFADSLNPIHDMEISTWDYIPPRPGFTYQLTTVVTNEGTVTEPNILAGFASDTEIYAPYFVPSGIYSGSHYWYNTPGTFPSLAPGSSQVITKNYTVPASVPLGYNLAFLDTVVYAPPVSHWLTDYSPWNNVDYFTTTIVGAYDPNFKEVSPRGVGAPGYISVNDSEMRYMVHFQNTGSYYAENIVVIDTLDRNLDITTLHPVYGSHPYTVEMNDSGVVKFKFDHIHLPDWTTNTAASNGMFTYNIKTRRGLTNGAQIRNRASIYFDFNAPILTNSTLNTIFDSVYFVITNTTHDSVCAGASTTFIANAHGTSTPHYQWRKNGSNVGADSVNYTTNVLTTGDVINCSLSASAGGASIDTSNDITMTVNPGPVAGTISGIDSVCPAGTVSLTGSVAGGTWTCGTASLATVGTTGIVTGVGAGSAIITYTKTNSCGSAAAHFTVRILPAVTPSVTFAVTPSDTVCAGDTVSLTATPINGGTAPSFEWSRFATVIATGLTAHYVPANGDMISCVMISSQHCASPDTVVSPGTTMVVNPPVTPADSITTTLAGDSITYLGQIVTCFSSLSYCGSTPTYQWYLNGALMPGATSSTFASSVYFNDTVYCVVHCSALPCSTRSSDTSNTIIIYADYLTDGVHGLLTSSDGFTLVPNPNNGSFLLTGIIKNRSNEALQYEVMDMLGKVMYTGSTTPHDGLIRQQVDMGGQIASGQYILRVHSSLGVEFIHFVLKD